MLRSRRWRPPRGSSSSSAPTPPSWPRPGTFRGRLSSWGLDQSPHITEVLETGRSFVVERLADLLPEGGTVRGLLADAGVRSLALVPLRGHDRVVGVLGVGWNEGGPLVAQDVVDAGDVRRRLWSGAGARRPLRCRARHRRHVAAQPAPGAPGPPRSPRAAGSVSRRHPRDPGGWRLVRRHPAARRSGLPGRRRCRGSWRRVPRPRWASSAPRCGHSRAPRPNRPSCSRPSTRACCRPTAPW